MSRSKTAKSIKADPELTCKTCAGDGISRTRPGPFRAFGRCESCDGFGMTAPHTNGQRRVWRERGHG